MRPTLLPGGADSKGKSSFTLPAVSRRTTHHTGLLYLSLRQRGTRRSTGQDGRPHLLGSVRRAPLSNATQFRRRARTCHRGRHGTINRRRAARTEADAGSGIRDSCALQRFRLWAHGTVVSMVECAFDAGQLSRPSPARGSTSVSLQLKRCVGGCHGQARRISHTEVSRSRGCGRHHAPRGRTWRRPASQLYGQPGHERAGLGHGTHKRAAMEH